MKTYHVTTQGGAIIKVQADAAQTSGTFVSLWVKPEKSVLTSKAAPGPTPELVAIFHEPAAVVVE